MMKKTAFLALILVFVLCLPMLAACDNTQGVEDTSGETTTKAPEETTKETTEETTEETIEETTEEINRVKPCNVKSR